MVQPGFNWRERCRNCTCVLGVGSDCDGPTCSIPYHPSHEQICARWSPDGCCCEQLGCLKHGRVYEVGSYYPRSIERPCTKCPCMAGQRIPSCSVEVCRPKCVDSVQVEGICCPVCQNGPNCVVPTRLFSQTSQRHAPIALNQSTIITDSFDQSRSFICQCQVAGGVAQCEHLSASVRQPVLDLIRSIISHNNVV
ncbi:hypothetical protein SNE40_021665 [Patella caerulea]